MRKVVNRFTSSPFAGFDPREKNILLFSRFEQACP